ncbi:hypothetical protein EYF80_006329 [Liparis tanakae]|uniref:Uncharacterized protein n=1 Tax=Liparis tanakae TaxID=230148 RepID=A0A4Z2J105_9TELE|nr:hypothetical protein EYF80_006329 [Liparis tanakae]
MFSQPLGTNAGSFAADEIMSERGGGPRFLRHEVSAAEVLLPPPRCPSVDDGQDAAGWGPERPAAGLLPRSPGTSEGLRPGGPEVYRGAASQRERRGALMSRRVWSRRDRRPA